MAKKYCMNCGSGNEYSGIPPEKCEKCKTNFEAVAKNIVKTWKKDENGQPIEITKELTEDLNENIHFEDSKFDSFMEEVPEKISEEEISRIFLADANKGINLRNLIKPKEPKKKEREQKSKPAKSKIQKGKNK